jgi:RND superfamily putative drug exporter
MARVISVRLPFIIAGVLALSFLLLMAVFRSVLVPLKAVVMNLLSIGAAYGVVVAVFQWGWLGRLAGIDRGGPIESFVPIILFAILFGLSMDYEVFLLSRMREEYQRTGDNSSAVAGGLASTARVITAAAAIMVTLFLSFVLGDERIIKMIGLGLAVAVLVDATLVRMLLVPATMELLGRANWWLPRWLDRAIPTLRIEAEPAFAGSSVGVPLSLATTPLPDGNGVPPASGAEQPPPRRVRQREY